MQKRISNLPFQGTAEQEAKLKEIIARHKDQPGAIMPCLQEAQEVYGYLPVEVQTMIAEGLGVSLEEVFGVSTFYSQFSVMTINDEVYGRLTPDEVDSILAKYAD